MVDPSWLDSPKPRPWTWLVAVIVSGIVAAGVVLLVLFAVAEAFVRGLNHG